MTVKPVFKKKEVIMEYPENDNISWGGTEEGTETIVIYVGEEQEHYKVGDKVLINFTQTMKEKPFKLFDKKYIRVYDEKAIICQLVDESV